MNPVYDELARRTEHLVNCAEDQLFARGPPALYNELTVDCEEMMCAIDFGRDMAFKTPPKVKQRPVTQ
jgi:hypothetical protein